MKQTALEYLEENLIAIPYSEQDFEYNNNCWNKAKEIEKEQKHSEYMRGWYDGVDITK